MKLSIFRYIAAGTILIGLFGGPLYDSVAQSPELSIRELLRFRIEAAGVPLEISVNNEPIIPLWCSPYSMSAGRINQHG